MYTLVSAQVGVSSEYMRSKILAAVEETLTTPKVQNGQPSAPAASLDETAPSAPLDDTGPSAPPAPVETFQSSECVVCLERQVGSTFSTDVDRCWQMLTNAGKCWHTLKNVDNV